MERKNRRTVSFLTRPTILAIATIGLGGTAKAEDAGTTAQSEAELRQALPDAQIKMHAGRISRISGPAMATGNSAAAAADAFSAKVAKGLSAKPEELRRTEVDSAKVMSTKDGDGVGLMYDRATGKYKFYLFRHVQVRGNVPVYGALLSTLVKNETGYPVVSAATTLRDLKDFVPAAATTDASVDEGKARAAIAAYADAKGATGNIFRTYDRIGKAEHVIFAGVEDVQEAPRMALQFTAESGGTPTTAAARFVVDAKTGEVLHAEPLLREANVGGTVRGMSTLGPRPYNPSDTACEAVVSTPMPHAEVSIVGEPLGYTSSTGYYYLTHSGSSAVTVNSPIQGQWFSVTDAAATVESLNISVVPPTAANFLHNAANTNEFIRAETMAYIHANRVRDFLLSYLPGYPGISTTTGFPISVNNSSLPPYSCPNATGWRHGINFCRQVPTGRNTAYGGVIYHEFGHAINDFGGRAYGPFDEGMADAISTALDEVPGLGYGWANNNCSTPLRWVDNDCMYHATNCTTLCGSSAHDCGRLISGIIWDVRQRLMTTHPGDYRDIMNALMFSVIPLSNSGQVNPATLHDFLALDDDDGNLANGTPHRTEICGGFNQHGITDSNCPAAPTTPCEGVCSPTTFSWSGSYWSGELGTGAVCRETTQTINGGNCGNLAGGRKLYVNGQEMICNNQNWTTVPAKVGDGYCITTTPGDYNWAYFQVW